MHLVNEVRVFAGLEVFNHLVALYSIKGRTKICEEGADVVACLL